MEVNSVNDKLPKDNKYVLVHLTKDNWSDSNDPSKNYYWKVAKFVRGLTIDEREKLPDDHQKKFSWSSCDEGFNNHRGFNWNEFGPGSYFGQEVDFWCELPAVP